MNLPEPVMLVDTDYDKIELANRQFCHLLSINQYQDNTELIQERLSQKIFQPHFCLEDIEGFEENSHNNKF